MQRDGQDFVAFHSGNHDAILHQVLAEASGAFQSFPLQIWIPAIMSSAALPAPNNDESIFASMQMLLYP